MSISRSRVEIEPAREDEGKEERKRTGRDSAWRRKIYLRIYKADTSRHPRRTVADVVAARFYLSFVRRRNCSPQVSLIIFSVHFKSWRQPLLPLTARPVPAASTSSR